MSDGPRWLFWVKAIAAVVGLLLAVNALLIALSDPGGPFGRAARSVFFMVAEQSCDPATLSPTEFDACISDGGTEVSR